MQLNPAWLPIKCGGVTFTQFVTYNVNQNVSTLVGRGTLHAIGIIVMLVFAPYDESLTTRKIWHVQQSLRVAKVCHDRQV